MQKRILVTSPHSAFAELLRSSLEESGRYRVHLTQTAKAALAAVEREPFDLAIFDADVEDEQAASAGSRLMERLPEMVLMVIPPDGDPTHLSLVNFTPHAYLERPFYLPDLLTRLDYLLEPAEQHARHPIPVTTGSGLAAWLHESGPAPEGLRELLAGRGIEQALVVQDGRWVDLGGDLGEAGASEAAGWVRKHWDQVSDLARYIELGAAGEERLLYVTRLMGGLALATLSDAYGPVSQARIAARGLAKDLLELSAGVEAAPGGADAGEALLQRVDQVSAGRSDPLEGLVLPGEERDIPALHEAEEVMTLSELLGGDQPQEHTGLITPSEWEAAAPEDAADELVLPWEEESPTGETARTPLSDTRPVALAHEPEITVPVFVQISYTCILIPAQERHRLVGELRQSLEHGLPHICLGLGWQLETMRVQPEYLLWVAQVTPTVSPGNVVRMVRTRTSETIFSRFPELLEKNMNGDFWAPGYLVVSGSQAPNDQLVRDFITQTRRRQGIY